MQDGLAVNLYADAALKAEDVAVTMRTAYPDDGRVVLDVAMKGRVLRLRIPAWCTNATVSAAGEPARAAAPGWFDIERSFAKPVRVVLDLPMPIRLVPGCRAQEGRVAVMRGPCVYALAMGDGAEGDHEVDLWDLDAAEPPVWNAARRTVEATFRNRNRGRERRRLSLVRYSSDVHDRTYFDLAASPSSTSALDVATE